jgi:hypothetical protein
LKVTNTDIETIMNADLVPDEKYEFKIVQVFDQPEPDDWDEDAHGPFQSAWSKATCQIEKAQDEALNTPEILGRRLPLWLISTGRFPRRGLNSLMKNLCINKPGEGWENGVPDGDTQNLEGVTFTGSARRYKKKNGEWEQEVRPLTY